MPTYKRRHRFISVYNAMLGGAAVPWYLAGGVPLANTLAAFQPIGAANIAASYVNIVTPGTNDCTAPIAAPTFAAATGWTFNGTTQYLLVGNSAIKADVPLSMIALFNADNATATHALLSICRASSEDNRFNVNAAGAVAGDPIRVTAGRAPTYGSADSTSAYSAATWHVGAGVYSANNSRSSFLDGGSKGTETTSATPVFLGATYIGVLHNSIALASYLAGKIAACAFYNIALSDAQVLAISTAMAALV